MSRPEPRVFLDTNVIFSALYSPQGAPGLIMARFIEGKFRVVVSPQVLEETVRTIREKLPGALPVLKNLLENAPLEVSADPPSEALRIWENDLNAADAAILCAAIMAKPDYFITGDNHFLGKPALAKKAGLNIISPAQFLNIN